MTLAGAAQAGVATVEAEAESGVVGAGGAGETGERVQAREGP
ncbi:MAG: hypothetical protein M5U12_04265 [Verrucomicrobia bacterium]|nr:hypothetical protein [Verrucomicrobiota bacterium]